MVNEGMFLNKVKDAGIFIGQCEKVSEQKAAALETLTEGAPGSCAEANPTDGCFRRSLCMRNSTTLTRGHRAHLLSLRQRHPRPGPQGTAPRPHAALRKVCPGPHNPLRRSGPAQLLWEGSPDNPQRAGEFCPLIQTALHPCIGPQKQHMGYMANFKHSRTHIF